MAGHREGPAKGDEGSSEMDNIEGNIQGLKKRKNIGDED